MKLLATLAAILVLGFTLFASSRPASAFDFFGTKTNPACTPQTKDSPVCQPPKDEGNPVVRVIRIAASVVATIAGFLAVLMIVISGFQFVTSGGNDEAVANARKRITNSIIGLIIVATAWVIVRFVTDNIIQ